YQSVDADRRRLYVAHLGDSTLDVIDLDTLTVSATVPDIAGVHGVLAAPEIGRVFASATGTNELVTLDASTNQVIGRTPTGSFPDGIAYAVGLVERRGRIEARVTDSSHWLAHCTRTLGAGATTSPVARVSAMYATSSSGSCRTPPTRSRRTWRTMPEGAWCRLG